MIQRVGRTFFNTLTPTPQSANSSIPPTLDIIHWVNYNISCTTYKKAVENVMALETLELFPSNRA